MIHRIAFTRARVLASAVAGALLVYGCSAAPPSQTEAVGRESEAVLGTTSYTSCTGGDIPAIDLGYAYGRVAINSPALRGIGESAECAGGAGPAGLTRPSAVSSCPSCADAR